MTWITSEDEADYSDSPIDETALELRSCGWHPKTPLPLPPPPATDLSDAGRKMLRNAIALATSIENWKEGVSQSRFAFADDNTADKAGCMRLSSAHEALEHCIDRIDKGTHLRFDDLRYKIDPYFRKINIIEPERSRNITLPALLRVQPLANLRAHRAESWTEMSEHEAKFRSWIWRQMITKSSYICHSQVFFLVLLCAPKAKLVLLAESVFNPDDSSRFENTVGEGLEKYAEAFEQDVGRVREVFGEVTALLHAQDVEVEDEY